MRVPMVDGRTLRGKIPTPKQAAGPPDLARPERIKTAQTGEVIVLTLPVPPSVNNLYANGRDGKRYKTDVAKNYGERVNRRLLVQRTIVFQGPIGVRIRVYRARQSGDIDNFKKALYDSLKGHCWNDDSQIVYEEAFRYDDPKNARVEVEIWEVKT